MYQCVESKGFEIIPAVGSSYVEIAAEIIKQT